MSLEHTCIVDVDESSLMWLCESVYMCFVNMCMVGFVNLLNCILVEIWWMWWLCELVYTWIGGFCRWLWIIELGSNCMSYLLVRIHLANLFDDNYFGNRNEVRIIYIYIYIWLGDSFDNDNSSSMLWNDELYLLSRLGKSLCDLHDWCCEVMSLFWWLD